VKHIDFLEIIAQVFAFVGPQDSQGQANQGPQVHHRVSAAVVLAKFVDLGMAVMATGNAIIRSRGLDLLILQASEFETLFLEPGLQEAAAAAATVIIGTVGRHIDKILFAHHTPDHITQILGNGITITLANNLAGVLDGELYFQILVPVRVDLQFALSNPFGVVLVDVLDLKIVFQVEFFQSGPD
jgi:hypothetical protein